MRRMRFAICWTIYSIRLSRISNTIRTWGEMYWLERLATRKLCNSAGNC